jgi:hypothetical protein
LFRSFYNAPQSWKADINSLPQLKNPFNHRRRGTQILRILRKFKIKKVLDLTHLLYDGGEK